MKQKRFAGMANRAFRTVAACAVGMMLAGICSCGGKASAQGGSTASAVGAQKAETKAEKKAGAMSIDELKKLPPSPESDFLVKPTDDSFTAVMVTEYKGNDQVVVIPATIQGLPVKWIGSNGPHTDGDGLFEDKTNLVAVVIPESATCIMQYSFSGCKNLSSVVLPSTLKMIGHAAFCDCSKLTSIELPAGLPCINAFAFARTGLTSVKLPEGLVAIGASAFRGTPLTSVSLPKSLRLMGSDPDGSFTGCDSLADIQIPADHAISLDKRYICEYEETFEQFFSGTKITESIILQKQLKETKTRKMSDAKRDSLLGDIKKQVGDGFSWAGW